MVAGDDPSPAPATSTREKGPNDRADLQGGAENAVDPNARDREIVDDPSTTNDEVVKKSKESGKSLFPVAVSTENNHSEGKPRERRGREKTKSINGEIGSQINNVSTKGGRLQRQKRNEKPPPELRINSRAALWASSDVDRCRINHPRQRQRESGNQMPASGGGSRTRAKEVWGATHARWTKNAEQFAKQVTAEPMKNAGKCAEEASAKGRFDVRVENDHSAGDDSQHASSNPGRQFSKRFDVREESNRNARDDRQHASGNAGSPISLKFDVQKESDHSAKDDRQHTGGGGGWKTSRIGITIGPDCGRSYGRNSRVQKEWDKIDNNHTKSPIEGQMESLLACLDDAEVGRLSTVSARLPIELADGGGGSIPMVQEQILADAAGKMMDRWPYHDKWTKDEARLAGKILLRMEREEVFCHEATLPSQSAIGAQTPTKNAFPCQLRLQKEHYLAVINAYAKVTREDETASLRADNLLDHMEKRSSEGRLDLKPDRLTINTAIGAQAKHALSGTLSMNNVSAAERMLNLLEQEYNFGDRTMQPTARTYSKFIDLYAKHGRADDASRALKRMEYQYRNGNKAALPKTIHYTSVIDAFAKKNDSSGRAAGAAEEVLRSMLDLYDRGDYHLAPDAIVFSATIDAYSKCDRSDAAERSLRLLDLMDKYEVAPDIVTWNIVLNTLSRRKKYHSKAKEILKFIEQNHKLRADAFTYNAVIKCCSPKDAEELIQHWEMQYKLGHTDERPDSYTFTWLIKQWTMTDIIGFEEKCLDILSWMEENEVVGINRITYNEVMKAISRSMREDAGDLAQGVFDRLVARYGRNHDREFRPDRFSFMALLNAYCRNCASSHYALRAEDVLFDMMDSNHLPDRKLCNNVLSAWARSNSDDAVAHAERICERMDLLGIDIDGVVFNSLINVYAKSQDCKKSMNALKVLGRMDDRNVDPTSVTYTLLLEACLGDEECLLQVFESCINHGMLDERLKSSFREHGPLCVKEQLSGEVPYIWTQHANRGPGVLSRNQIRGLMKRGSTGADVRRFGWSR